MPIEVRDLGLQPKVTEGKDGVMNAELVPSTEWVATGKEVHDPEFAKLMDGAAEAADEDRARKEAALGLDKITDPYGNVETLRLDEIEEKKKLGYGKKERTMRMIVPSLPWQKESMLSGGRTLIVYKPGGKRVVVWDKGVRVEQEG